MKLLISKHFVASAVVRLLIALASTSVAFGQDIELSAKSLWKSATEIELTLDAVIAPGIHIYGLEQQRPILATRIMVEPSDAIVSVGEFESVTPPKRRSHPQLGIDVHEHFDRVQWRTLIKIRNSAKPIQIDGSVFVQPCEEDRCFPPETYSFRSEVGELLTDSAMPSSLPATETLSPLSIVAMPTERLVASGCICKELFTTHLTNFQQKRSKHVFKIHYSSIPKASIFNARRCPLRHRGFCH